ncbi:MAG: M48 family metallopeptidase, partial [Ramlibacter sp.]
MNRFLQLALDLFDPPAPAPAPVSPALPAAAVQSTPAPAEPLDRVLPPAQFGHPRANRQAVLGTTRVSYEFRRARRRNIGFVVGPEGLTVSAPKWVPLYEVESAIQSKSSWILKKLDEMRARDERLETARIQWKDGAAFPFLGDTVIVVLDPRHGFEGGGMLHTDVDALPGVPRLALHLGLSHAATESQIRDAVQAWLMRQAKRVFTERLDHFAPRLGVQWKKLSLSSASTRWGTAGADG